MTTDLDRLKVWMAEKEIYPAKLARLMRIRDSMLSPILNDRRNISDGFKWRFLIAFGAETTDSVFQDKGKRPSHRLAEHVVNPEKYAAHRVVAKAVMKGEMLSASEYKCHFCSRQARDWHHQSYHPDDHLCVVPLCRSCHYKVDRGKLDVPFGVVPTRVGLIRIAIATTPTP